jgi:curved DNA-binding protein CbpA
MAAMTTMLDPYATLGVPATASRAEAARAHRRLAKRFHPDVNPGPEASERMRRINEAWRILSNPARRARYDADRVARPAITRPAAWSAYGPRTGSVTWAPWPSDRTAAPRQRRPVRAPEPAPSFGDRPAVLAAVWLFLVLFSFVGAWLGSIAR